jgi:hypothetical protein
MESESTHLRAKETNRPGSSLRLPAFAGTHPASKNPSSDITTRGTAATVLCLKQPARCDVFSATSKR